VSDLIDLGRQGDVFVLTMAAGENRWNTSFVREFEESLDEVMDSDGAVALVTTSESEKFYSNGLDLEWISSEGEHPGGDRRVFGAEIMALFGRLITLPIPTVAAVNGHAFGAGFMIALCHDLRVMREDRGYLCANEVEIGMVIPDPELALFRHKIPANAFHETAVLARRWTGAAALNAGIVHATAPLESIRETAIDLAESHLRVGQSRDVLGRMKERIYGENAAISCVHGAAHMLKHSRDFSGSAG